MAKPTKRNVGAPLRWYRNSAATKGSANYPKYVLSMDEADMGRDGIIHRNVRDFLLDKEI